MQNAKLIALLQTFSKEELKRFDDFIKSPYFNKREAPVRLYSVLLPFYPDFANLKPEKLFKKAFPDKPDYNEPYLRNVLSDLFELAEQFVGYEVVRYSPIFFGNMIYGLLSKQQFKAAEANLKQMETTIQNGQYSFPNEYGMYCYYYLLKMRLHDRQEQRLEYSHAHQQLATHIKYNAIYDFSCRLYEMNNDDEVYYTYHYDTEFAERFVSILQPQDFEDEPIVAIVYYRLQLQLNPVWQSWRNLYVNLEEHKTKLPDSEIFVANQALTNFIVRQKRHQDTLPEDIPEKEFALYEEMIDLRQKNNQPFSGTIFENMVAIGTKLKGTEWAKQFIETNSPLLPQNLREGLTAYCLARLNFQTGNYTETLAIINSISPYYHNYYFAVKSLQLMAYYETDDYDAFMATLDAFKHTLKNHPELAQKHRIAHTQMNSIMLKLYRLRQQYNAKLAHQIQELLNNPDLSLYSRQWAQIRFANLQQKNLRSQTAATTAKSQ